MPPALPAPLKGFLLNAPPLPGNPPAPTPGAPAVVPTAVAAPKAPSPQKASISSAFDFESPATDTPLPGREPHPPVTSANLSSSSTVVADVSLSTHWFLLYLNDYCCIVR